MFRRRLRVLVAKTPVAGIILSVATLYGLWLVATATTVPEFISAATIVGLPRTRWLGRPQICW